VTFLQKSEATIRDHSTKVGGRNQGPFYKSRTPPSGTILQTKEAVVKGSFFNGRGCNKRLFNSKKKQPFYRRRKS
jgi:hypothetical protein